jgi:hypothetical protein
MARLTDLLTFTYKGAQGDTGETGVGVSDVEISANGSLIISLTDSTSIDAGRVYENKITVSNTEPIDPSLYDLWVDIN